MQKKILFDEQGVLPGTSYTKGQWKEIATHNENVVRGFFGEYRFLSNFWPAKIFLDDEEYSCVENAYQAAKYSKEKREYLKTCEPKEAILYAEAHPIIDTESWNAKKLDVMRGLIKQKFERITNPDLYQKLLSTGDRYLEETNYWEDTFWGVSVKNCNEVGKGENNLGKLLMEIRQSLM